MKGFAVIIFLKFYYSTWQICVDVFLYFYLYSSLLILCQAGVTITQSRSVSIVIFRNLQIVSPCPLVLIVTVAQFAAEAT